VRAVATAMIVAGVALLTGCGGAANKSTTSTSGAASPTRTAGTTTAAATTSIASTTSPAAAPPVAEIINPVGTGVTTITGDGSLSAAESDGQGGWFVAGSFTELDGVRVRGLAHVLAGGTIDPNWHSSLVSSGRTALAVSDNTLYAAGSIGDTDRSRLYAIDAASGTRLRALPVPPGPISALALDGGRLLIATSTTTSRSHPSCLGAIDPNTGSAVGEFTADVRLTPELGCVEAMRADGASVYIGGAFHTVDGRSWPRVARLAASTGTLDQTWSPPSAAVPSTIYALTVGAHAVVLAGASPALSALTPVSGTPVPGWRPPAGLTAPTSVAIIGERLFVAAQLHGQNRLVVLRMRNGSLERALTPPAGRIPGIISPSGSAALVALLRSG
jgi:hypothetical protein